MEVACYSGKGGIDDCCVEGDEEGAEVEGRDDQKESGGGRGWYS